ncbi:unnamed protein product [Arctogadus glacialis]
MFLRLHFSSWQKSSSVLRLPFLFVFTQPSQLSSEGCVRRASESCGASHTEPLRRRPGPRGTPLGQIRPQLGPSAAQAEAPAAGDTAALGPPPPTSSMLPASLPPWFLHGDSRPY